MFSQTTNYRNEMTVRFMDARRVEHRAIVASLAEAFELIDIRKAVTFTIRRGTRIIHANS